MTEPFHLREMNKDDLDTVRSWRNHKSILQHMYSQHEISAAEHQEWFAKMTANDEVRLLILENAGTPLGYAKLELLNKTTECIWGIYTAPDVGKGIGSMLANAVLKFAFINLHVKTVFAEALSTNSRSIAFHKKVGFRETHVLKNHFNNGKDCLDVVCLAQKREDWELEKARTHDT